MRTNKTTQAIKNAISKPGTLVIPRTLSTTFGYELTFMPQMFDRIYTRTKGAVKSWDDYRDYVSAQSRVMRDVAAWHNRRSGDDNSNLYNRFGEFKTDPMVVEVTTKPTNKGPRLRNIVRDAFKYAEHSDLQPRALCSRGGGAHLHVGIPFASKRGWDSEDNAEETNEQAQAFAAAMQHEMLINPWLAWAFANPLDDNNAQSIQYMMRRGPVREKKHEREESPYMADMRRRDYMRSKSNNILVLSNDIKEYEKEIVRMTNEMHTVENWKPDFLLYPNVWRSVPDDINDYVRYKKTARIRLHRYTRDLLRDMESDYAQHVEQLHEEALREHEERMGPLHGPWPDDRPLHTCEEMPMVPWCEMKTHMSKCFAVTHRLAYNTMEFRCFMMYEHHADHAKQIVLADALVKRALHKIATSQGVRFHNEIKARKLKEMKYSEAKREFCNMLLSLDIDPAYYREECVNIALRKRALRARKISI